MCVCVCVSSNNTSMQALCEVCSASPGHSPCLLCKRLEVVTEQSVHLTDVVTEVVKLSLEDVQ